MTYPNPLQFPEGAPEPPKNLPKAIRNNYRELSQQLDIQLKLKRLADETCYPWQINCE
jgi:phage terminase small subunit